MFIGLNPSTADEVKNDPTVTRCLNFAVKWGFGGMYLLNLFAYRASRPEVMKAFHDPIGPENDEYLAEYGEKSDLMVAVWGNQGMFKGRAEEVVKMFPQIYCLKMTKKNQPHHPLYLPLDIGYKRIEKSQGGF